MTTTPFTNSGSRVTNVTDTFALCALHADLCFASPHALPGPRHLPPPSEVADTEALQGCQHPSLRWALSKTVHSTVKMSTHYIIQRSYRKCNREEEQSLSSFYSEGKTNKSNSPSIVKNIKQFLWGLFAEPVRKDLIITIFLWLCVTYNDVWGLSFLFLFIYSSLM